MVEVIDGNLVFNIPQINWAAFAGFGFWDWAQLYLWISGVYGVITHWHSARQMNKWNSARIEKNISVWKERRDSSNYNDPYVNTEKEFWEWLSDDYDENKYKSLSKLMKPIRARGFLLSFLYHIALGLLFRILSLVLGVIGMVFIPICFGKASWRNGCLKSAWHWHLSPEDVHREFNGG